MKQFEGVPELDSNNVSDYLKTDISRIGKAPWLFWPSELYSFGKIFRLKYKFSKFFPLIFYSDHGVSLTDYFESHELESAARYHLTFSYFKYLKNSKLIKKRVTLVEHPYLFYKRYHFLKPKKNRKGTIVFLPHSNPSLGNKLDTAISDYVSSLKNLGPDFEPFVLCLHIHDVNLSNLENLKKFKLPIISMGNTLHQDFVDRFYQNISNFKYATSSVFGSHSFLCDDFGVNFFVYGYSKLQVELRASSEIYEHLEEIYSVKNIDTREGKDFFLDKLLGRKSELNNTWNYPRIIYYFDLLTLLFPIVKLYFQSIFQIVRFFSKNKM